MKKKPILEFTSLTGLSGLEILDRVAQAKIEGVIGSYVTSFAYDELMTTESGTHYYYVYAVSGSFMHF